MHYQHAQIILTTKHEKSKAIGPAFNTLLNAQVLEYPFDTDQLGTFTGEIPRQLSALECARSKCLLGIEASQSPYGLASEGSFGPHPELPFLKSDHEILYFMDQKHGFELYVSSLSENTNLSMQTIESFDELQQFCQKVQFPSHALIMEPSPRSLDHSLLFKGLNSPKALMQAFEMCLNASPEKRVWVETDMRAHMNPTRMQVIEQLAWDLSKRLSRLCPACQMPGWGIIAQESGLACRDCGQKTAWIQKTIEGCVRCPHQEHRQKAEYADPASCDRCNP